MNNKDSFSMFNDNIDIKYTELKTSEKSEFKTKNNKNKKYNEKKIVTEYLKSQNGIEFLSNKFILNTEKSIIEKVDDIIDFYITWASEIPVRRNLYLNKYDWLKKVEEFCEKHTNVLNEIPIKNKFQNNL